MPELLAEGGHQRKHRVRLHQLLESADGPVRIASAYVTDRELLVGVRDRDIRLVTSLFAYENNTREWRVPVHWLDWRDDQDTFPWKAPNFTFWNVSDENHSDLRKGVREYFVGE